ETEPNGTTASAGDLACGIEGGIGTPGEVDFFNLGIPDSGSRVFTLVDGVASSNTDFDLRVTSATDTLEYDDANNDTPFGPVSPNVAGTPVGGVPVYLRLNQFSATQVSEPYRVYATVQPPSSTATPEVKPNNSTAGATSGSRLYFSGALSSATDVDV